MAVDLADDAPAPTPMPKQEELGFGVTKESAEVAVEVRKRKNRRGALGDTEGRGEGPRGAPGGASATSQRERDQA